MGGKKSKGEGLWKRKAGFREGACIDSGDFYCATPVPKRGTWV